MRGNDEAGADPFLQASNLVADIMRNCYPHAHTNLKTDTCRQTPADKDTYTLLGCAGSQIPRDSVKCYFSFCATAANPPSPQPALEKITIRHPNVTMNSLACSASTLLPRRRLRYVVTASKKALHAFLKAFKKISAVEVTQGFNDKYSLSIDK